MEFKRPKRDLSKEVREVIESKESSIEGESYDLIESYDASDLISSGSTLVNLACSGMIEGAYYLGGVINLISPSGIGKTLMALTLNAEAASDKRFNKYFLEYNEPEAAMHFPIKSMFGEETADRLVFTPKDRSKPYTVQMWHNDVYENFVTKKRKMIHVTDSFDALTSEDDLKSTKKDGKEKMGKGGYKTEKAIVSSATFPKIVGLVEKTKSVMMVIFQTRRNIGGGLFGPQLCHSGGDAHKFYATIEGWLEPRGKIKQKVRGVDEEIGNWVNVKISKSKLTGLKRSVRIRIMDRYGIDDIGSCIEWLTDRGFWGLKKKVDDELDDEEDFDEDEKKKGKVIDTKGDFDISGKLESVIKYIEKNNYENDLKEIVKKAWYEIEGELEPKRKPKYR